MAAANVAWIIASQGRRVLLLDWDLEAPGLPHYLKPFITDIDLTSTDGVIDIMIEYAAQAIERTGRADKNNAMFASCKKWRCHSEDVRLSGPCCQIGRPGASDTLCRADP